MKRFKTMTGLNSVYDLTEKNYSMVTKQKYPYVEIGENGEKRRYAVCPACDNPIQIIRKSEPGSVLKAEGEFIYTGVREPYSLYGKHIKKDMPMARYNERSYRFCPYASKSIQVKKTMKKEGMTAYEQDIYKAVMEYFDLAVYVIQQDTGIHVSKKIAENILRRYIKQEGYMYYWATLYNIPWMMLYYADPIPCYGLCVKRNTELWKYLHWRKDVAMTASRISGYDLVGNNKKFLNLYVTLQDHKRYVVEDEVKETIVLAVYSVKSDGRRKEEHKIMLNINEYRFPRLTESAKYRNENIKSLTTKYNEK